MHLMIKKIFLHSHPGPEPTTPVTPQPSSSSSTSRRESARVYHNLVRISFILPYLCFYSLSVLFIYFFPNIILFLCSFLLCLTQVVQNILDTERAHVSELQVSFHHQLFFCHLVYIQKCTWLTL